MASQSEELAVLIEPISFMRTYGKIIIEIVEVYLRIDECKWVAKVIININWIKLVPAKINLFKIVICYHYHHNFIIISVTIIVFYKTLSYLPSIYIAILFLFSEGDHCEFLTDEIIDSFVVQSSQSILKE